MALIHVISYPYTHLILPCYRTKNKEVTRSLHEQCMYMAQISNESSRGNNKISAKKLNAFVVILDEIFVPYTERQ